MTWSEFKSAVRAYLTVHNRRQGIQTLIDNLIAAAVVDLQGGIPELRIGFTTVYPASRFVADGYAAKARYPAGATITGAFARDPADHSKRFDFDTVTTLAGEQAMIDGLTAPGQRQIFIRAASGVFRVVPSPIDDGSEVVLVWDGKKLDFEDDDDLPDVYDTDVAMVVGDFVQARLARQVDNDLAAAQSFMGTFLVGKRRLKSDLNEASNVIARAKRS